MNQQRSGSNSYHESSLEFSKRSQVYLGARTSDVTQRSSLFHRRHSRDLHMLNFGTKFLLGWETVTTRKFWSFPELFKFTIHRLLFMKHYSSFYYSSFLKSIWDIETSCKNFTIHQTLFTPEKKFVIQHFSKSSLQVSNSQNLKGLAAYSGDTFQKHHVG